MAMNREKEGVANNETNFAQNWITMRDGRVFDVDHVLERIRDIKTAGKVGRSDCPTIPEN